MDNEEYKKDSPKEVQKRIRHHLTGSKSAALKKKMAGKMKGYEHQSTLEAIRKNLRKERISYGEIAELSRHKKHLIKSGDTELAEAAGIPEHEFNRHRK